MMPKMDLEMDRTALSKQVHDRGWFHQIDLGHGLITPGADQSLIKLNSLGMPQDLSGKRVLDIGAWDGYFSFEAERRGATVVSTDSLCWTGLGAMDKGGFDLAKRALGSKVEERVLRVEDLPDADLGTFDIVLFLGVLYHATDPLGYLKIVRSLTAGFAIIETHVDLVEIQRPALAYYPGATLNGDGTNFFGPNEAAVHGMCQDAGFSRVETVQEAQQASRMTFHAYA